MTGVFSLLIALSVSLIVTRIAAMALMFTGLSREAARFQARSAFSGCGYTTREAENIVNHPVRRRIVMILMLLGNIGIATVVATIMISVSNAKEASFQEQFLRLVILTLGVIVLFFLFSSRWIERQMNKVIAWALKRFTRLEVRDYNALLQLADGYAVSEMLIESEHWVTGRALKELRLSDEGILILGIHRKQGSYRGIPRADDVIQPGDNLILYGNLDHIQSLDRRRVGSHGDQNHERQVAIQAKSEATQTAGSPEEEAAAST